MKSVENDRVRKTIYEPRKSLKVWIIKYFKSKLANVFSFYVSCKEKSVAWQIN